MKPGLQQGTDATASEALGLLEVANEDITRRVTEVQKMSEEGTLAVGGCLGELVTTAQAYVAEVRDRLGGSEVGSRADSGADLTTAMEAQSAATSHFSNDIAQAIRRQVEVADRAKSYLSDIVSTAAGMSNLTRASKMLAINAMIEASRMGEEGTAFNVIAHEMSDLSQRIAETNQLIAGLAESLREALPELAAEARSMENRTDGFSTDLSGHVQSVSMAARGLHDTIDWLIRTGEGRVDTMLQLSQDGLSHLQFQDPCSQSLGHVLAEMTEFREDLTAVLTGQEKRRSIRAVKPAATPCEVAAADTGELLLF